MYVFGTYISNIFGTYIGHKEIVQTFTKRGPIRVTEKDHHQFIKITKSYRIPCCFDY